MTETFIHDEDLDLNDFTPAMRQFIEVKRRYPETLVLFRMGDFYETFFDDAAKANRLIGITLTKRGKLKNGDPIPMAGIPMVSLDQYVARLVRLGESVVIAEQLGTPGKGLMERRISRIITPGTLTDTSLLPEKDDAVLLSVSRPAGKNAVWGFAWLTLSNGDFFATEVTDEQFDSEVARISPSEVLVSEKLRDAMRETHPELTVTPMPAWHFDAEHGEEALKKTFGLDNLDAWGVTGKTGVLAAANALLDYTAETQVDMIPFISPLKLTDESEYIIIDPASRRNLEISDTIRSEGRGPTLFSVLDRCGTSMAAASFAAGSTCRLQRPTRPAAATTPSRRSPRIRTSRASSRRGFRGYPTSSASQAASHLERCVRRNWRRFATRFRSWASSMPKSPPARRPGSA